MVKPSQLPTLAELRAFESIARLRSVSGAAQELNCSQPCITNRLKSLEERWGVSLFIRSTRMLEWTDKTHHIYSKVVGVLTDVASIASEAIDVGGSLLSVSVSPSFASMWLVNRLSSLEEMHPEIELNLLATNRNVDLTRGDIDVAIRLMPLNSQSNEGLFNVPLAKEKLLVVCAPSYLKRGTGCIQLQELHLEKLLHEENTDHWHRFFREMDASIYDKLSGPTFNNADLVIKSAIAGRGIAIVREMLVIDVIRQGLLVQCLPNFIFSELAYHFVCRDAVREDKKTLNFMNWLLLEANKSI